MADLRFFNAERTRVAVTKRNKQKIRSLYKQVSKDIQRELKSLKGKANISSIMQRNYLRQLQKQIDQSLADVDVNLEKIIKTGIRDTAQGAVVDAQTMLLNAGIHIKGAFSHVPQDIVARVTSGQIYQSNWSLSKAIWSNNKKIHNDINKIISKGIAENKSAYDIAKDLEKYVTPGAQKPWDWGKVYPGTNKVIDYNAQRLSRTLVSHAYQQSLVETVKKNPYVVGLRWEASNSDRCCDLCQERDGKIFPVEDCPLDHPNGMCTQTVVFDRPLKDIASDLAEKASEPLKSPEYQAWREYIKSQS